jgi:hypothetical protein
MTPDNFAYATNGHGIVERDLLAGAERTLTAIKVTFTIEVPA